jgi:HEPN domain-containing protein
MDDKIKYWLDIAEYDLDTAKSLLESGRYLYVGFMCHQVIEKTTKAYIQGVISEMPPKTHNLTLLLNKAILIDRLSVDQLDFIDEVEPLNIETRYPSYKQEIIERLDKEYSDKLLKRTGDIYVWIKKELSQKLENS